MSDAISNYGRMSQSNAALRSALDKVDKKMETSPLLRARLVLPHRKPNPALELTK